MSIFTLFSVIVYSITAILVVGLIFYRRPIQMIIANRNSKGTRIEFVRQIQEDGKARYYTNVNGKYLVGSMYYDGEVAHEAYQEYVTRAQNGELEGTKVLESITVKNTA